VCSVVNQNETQQSYLISYLKIEMDTYD